MKAERSPVPPPRPPDCHLLYLDYPVCNKHTISPCRVPCLLSDPVSIIGRKGGGGAGIRGGKGEKGGGNVLLHIAVSVLGKKCLLLLYI